MLFEIQAYLEDIFYRSNFKDSDGYAVKLANYYFNFSRNLNEEEFLRKIGRIKTIFYINNKSLKRRGFEILITRKLYKKFKKKTSIITYSPNDFLLEKQVFIKAKRITVDLIFDKFKSAVESRTINAFWKSRKKNILNPNPEKIAQSLFSMFVLGSLGDRGYLLREIFSGIGYIDFGIIISKKMHLVEMKVVKKLTDIGVSQLKIYMDSENQKKGYLILINSGEIINLNNSSIQNFGDGKKIYKKIININPEIPSKSKNL